MQNNTFIVEKEEAWELLKPYAQDFYDVISGGFKDFAEMQAHKPVFEGNTKALLLWEYIHQRMKKLSLKHDGKIKLERKQRMYFLNIHNKIALRFKKFDEHYKSGNINTKQVKAFRNRSHEGCDQVQPCSVAWMEGVPLRGIELFGF